jgi:predicted dehydrogenase
VLRVALIGLGHVAQRIHLPALESIPELQLVGASEIDAERRERVGRAASIPSLYQDAGDLLSRERPDIVIVGTPPAQHLEHCLAALDVGAHVFCEKPFVESVADADRVVAEAARVGRLVAVNNQYRYMAMYREARSRLDQGEFGQAFLIQAWEQMYHPPSVETNWRAHLVRSTLFEFGTHALDLLCFLYGAQPTRVTAELPHPHAGIEADVVVALLLRFPGERIATMVLNRISHAPERYLEMRVDCERASLRLSLGGVARASLDWSKALGRPTGKVSLVKGGEARVEVGGRSRVIAREPRIAFASATAAHLRQFVNGIESGSIDQTPLLHARELLRLVEAGYESARLGATVTLDHA